MTHERLHSLVKLKFSLFDILIGFNNLKTSMIKDGFFRIKELTMRLSFLYAIAIYSTIIYGYFKANYYQLLSVTFISLIITIFLFILKYYKKDLKWIKILIYIYIPIGNIFLKDIFFLTQGNPLISTIFLHTQLILIMLISLCGLISGQQHVLYVGAISIVWVWIFTFCINNPFLWSLLALDTILFIGITIAIYFVYSSIYVLSVEFNKLGKTIHHQNNELTKLIDFKDRMLVMIIHDIKSPINRILQAGKVKSIRKEDITEPANQILSIVENILDTYKMEESKLPMSLSSIFIADLLKSAIRQVSYLLDGKKLSIITRIETNPSIEVDKNLIERVIINLLHNAIKYSNANTNIVLRLLSLEGKMRMEITDSGQGIAPENMDRIFDKYYQENAKNAGYTHSTGMGLTFCKLVIETSGGTIGAVSIINQGSTFWFELPVTSKNEITGQEITHTFPKTYKGTTDTEDLSISKYKLKIANVVVYQTGEILNIFKSSTYDNSPDFLYWKEEIINSSMAGNTVYFNHLKEIYTESIDN